MYDLDGDGEISKVQLGIIIECNRMIVDRHFILFQEELVAVLTMLCEGMDQKELVKIAERFVDEIDNSQVKQQSTIIKMVTEQ